MQRKDVDKIVQDALKNYKPEYKEEFWDSMEAALDAAEKQPGNSRRKAFLMLFTTLVVAGTAIGVLFMKDSNMTELAQNQQATNAMEKQNSKSVLESAGPAENKTAAKDLFTNNEHEETAVSTQENGQNVNAAGFNKNEIVSNAANKPSYNQIQTVTASKQVVTKKAETGYLARNNKNNTENTPAVTADSYKDDLKGNAIINEENNKLAENDAKTGISPEESSLIAEVNSNTENKEEKTFIALSDVPEMLAEKNTEIPVAKAQTVSGKQNSMALNDEEEKNQKDAASSANWQSVMYHFRDNAAYTGNEAKYNFNADTRHIAYEGYGALESRYNFAFDARLEKLRSSIGVYHQRNLRSLSFATTTGLTYAYNINTDPNGQLRIGAGLSMQDKSLYVNSIKYNDQIMPGYGFIWTTNENLVTPKTKSFAGDAGIWYQRPKWMAGVSAKNLFYAAGNHEVSAPPVKYTIAGGYRFNLGKNINLMPWAELHLYDPLYWIHSNLLLTWKDKLMVGTAYQNMNPWVGYGDISVFAGYEFNNKIRIHASLGRSSEWLYAGVKQDIFQAGIRYRIR